VKSFALAFGQVCFTTLVNSAEEGSSELDYIVAILELLATDIRRVASPIVSCDLDSGRRILGSRGPCSIKPCGPCICVRVL
jgi:hypothetical protein